jgi:hypothetical protein
LIHSGRGICFFFAEPEPEYCKIAAKCLKGRVSS